MKVLVVFGTRPEAVKCFPVVEALRSRRGCEVRVCVTAQHRQMLDQVLKLVGLTPDHDLDLMRPRPSLTDITSDVLRAVGDVLEEERPDRVLVQGDTTTTMATALAAFYRKIPVGHIEAGLRSFDNYSPFPEEVNRRVVGVVADMHFAPTEQARGNLIAENVPAAKVHVTGNTVIDALYAIRRLVGASGGTDPTVAPLLAKVRADGRRLVLVTSHRRENWGAGIENICRALRTLADRGDVHVAYPVHANPNVRGPVHAVLGDHPAVTLLEPIDYLPFVELMSAAHLVLTDSGGVQEEAPALGKPVLVLRDTTERPEGVAAGNARLVGVEAGRIVAAACELLDDAGVYRAMSQARNPYGNGDAAQKIAELILG